ncbi:MAG: FKBP-type peptidyl-prolyl cis-trans isomerase [Bacteroidales bacterium]
MKNFYLIRIAFAVALLCACGNDEEDTVDEVWKAENEQAFNAVAMNPAYTRIASQSNAGSVYYKALKEGAGTKTIYFTSTVRAYYTGSLIDGTVFDSAEPPYQSPVEFPVRTADYNYTSGVIDGWTTALMRMKEGDRWEVWIPQELAYGAASNSAIPAYSTLKFEIEIVKVFDIGEDTSD